ncbi:MAG: RelA/SpoT domain-containing protein [Crocosphaera sp.]
MNKIEWITPQYSKGKINKAGETLIQQNISDDDTLNTALEILSNWKGSHAFPLNSVQSSLRYRTKSIDNDFLIAQRLKRTSSITSKLQRFPNMKLSRMQDIGGCRAILSHISHVDILKRQLVNDLHSFNITREYNYIKKPKETGYRGIHLISEYCGKREEYRGLKIEIQIRSKIQHYWATAVEIIGTFTQQPLKAGLGDSKWLDFFRMMSVFMADVENNIDWKKKHKINELRQLEKILNVKQELSTYSVIVDVVEETKTKKGFFLIILDPKKKITNINFFKNRQLQEAIDSYKQKEKDSQDTDVVLVEAKSIQELKRGYPNYFADSEKFLNYLNCFLDS